MARTRLATARKKSEPVNRVVNGHAPISRSARAKERSKLRDVVVKAQAPRTRSTKIKKSSEPGDRVVKSRAPGRPRRAHKTVSSQRGYQHESIDEHRKRCPEDFPDLDFHQSWGSILTRKNPIMQALSPDIDRYWDMLNTTPALLQNHATSIADLYNASFKKFFSVDPISIHGHVSDAANPFVLTSLLLHLTAHSPKNPKKRTVSLLSEGDKAAPHIAVANASYGAGYGPLAYRSTAHSFRAVGCGPIPPVVETEDSENIDEQVRLVKANGCVALIVEIFRAGDGTVISEASWKALLKACKRHCLVLVVDEALTAIRCGAPFAHQLPRYRKHGLPDLILFGKAVRTNGIAIQWQGINILKLKITNEEERSNVISSWQERFTEMAPVADLLTSVGTLVLAGKEGWPQRAQKIGIVLRDIIEGESWNTANTISGLHSLIYLRQGDYARTTSPVMGAYANKYIRWLPVMDEVMTSKDELLRKVFGKDSLEHRRQVTEWFASIEVQPRWCSTCGGAVNERRSLCPRCVVPQCKDCQPGAHACPMEDLDN